MIFEHGKGRLRTLAGLVESARQAKEAGRVALALSYLRSIEIDADIFRVYAEQEIAAIEASLESERREAVNS